MNQCDGKKDAEKLKGNKKEEGGGAAKEATEMFLLGCQRQP